MPALNVDISDESHKTLQELSAQEGKSIQSIIDQAVELYRREVFIEDANTAFQELRDDPDAWAEEVQERALWDNTVGDGIEAE